MDEQQPSQSSEQKSASQRLSESMEARSEAQATPPPAAPTPQKPKEGINKYFIVGGVLIAILLIGGIYQVFFVPEAAKPVVTGEERSLSIVTYANTWRFDPEFIEVEQGDKLTLTIANNDDYDHGFAIDAFGISQRMPAQTTIQVEFVVTKAGDFPYYCSVSCGSGIVDGEERGHFDQIGLLHVRSAISETQDFGTPSAEALKEQARISAVMQEARAEAERLGFDITTFTVGVDDDLSIWEEHIAGTPAEVHEDILAALTDKEFYAVYFKDVSGEFVLWVFIDALGGDILAHEE